MIPTLLRMEFAKLWRLTSVRFGLLLLLVFPLLWAYAPGIFEVYGFFLVSGYQVPALSLLSSMQFLLPLLVAITAAELLGTEIANGTLPTILLRPVTRPNWLAAKLIVVGIYPFIMLAVFLVASLLAGLPFGFGGFFGGTGLGDAGLLGEGMLTPVAATQELVRGYLLAALALVPIGMLALFFTVVFMNAAGGALATLATLIFMQLLVVFPSLERFLLTTQLNAYAAPGSEVAWVVALICLYGALFAALAVVLFERKDF